MVKSIAKNGLNFLFETDKDSLNVGDIIYFGGEICRVTKLFVEDYKLKMECVNVFDKKQKFTNDDIQIDIANINQLVTENDIINNLLFYKEQIPFLKFDFTNYNFEDTLDNLKIELIFGHFLFHYYIEGSQNSYIEKWSLVQTFEYSGGLYLDIYVDLNVTDLVG